MNLAFIVGLSSDMPICALSGPVNLATFTSFSTGEQDSNCPMSTSSCSISLLSDVSVELLHFMLTKLLEGPDHLGVSDHLLDQLVFKLKKGIPNLI
ncbi:unnamed protein product [Protopolystoma xenopodis]|uniref:Uncharacterized protein n=1 Tax=Protopolystoma xenopodis TaxID=117903 RepID=A0A3S5ACM4_9PLAT|nr:unnamed protein product [Protopolystoma xenopodis]